MVLTYVSPQIIWKNWIIIKKEMDLNTYSMLQLSPYVDQLQIWIVSTEQFVVWQHRYQFLEDPN